MNSSFVIAGTVAAICLLQTSAATVAQDTGKSKITETDAGYIAWLGEEAFFGFRCNGVPRPLVYPLMAPGDIEMTRNYPQTDGVAGEAKDHPHHTSVWFGHGDINGVSFWDLKGGTVEKQTLEIKSEGGTPYIETTNNWVSDDETLATDVTRIRFGGDDKKRWIDFDFEMTALVDELKFGDTKEGTFAMRTHPQLRLENDPAAGVTKANGSAINSEGVEGKSIWGKNAKWVAYWGNVDGKPVGFAIMDHPQNLRHPTTWHARAYGLVAANPFGLHDFQGKVAGAGNHTVNKGQSIRFRYRIMLFAGEFSKELVESNFKEYSDQR